LPILAELEVPATVFAIAGRVGATSELPGAGERPLLCWDELRRLRHLGWEIGSHTWSHPDLTSLDDDELEQELVKSSDAVRAQLGERCTALAYPYGRTDARVVAAVRRAGYDAAFTVPRRWSRPEPLLWPRVTVWRGDSPAATAFKSSAPVRAVRGSRLGAALLATVGAAARGSNA
jgi:peptidoglycan/xylan/chitin deacetylase (PgdA/CDA1 family)